MNPPVLAFTVALGLCHLYLFWNLRRLFGGGSWQWAAAAILLLVYATIPFRTSIVGLPRGRLLANGIYLWIGFSLIATMCLAARDIVHFGAWLVDRKRGTAWASRLRFSRTIPAALAIAFVVFAYSLHEARTLAVRTLALRTDKLPAGVERVRIAAFADMHLLRSSSGDWVKSVVDGVNARKPDIVLALGDTVDDVLADEERLAALLRGIEAPRGKFAVIGNHEITRGLEQAIVFLERSGFEVVRGRTVEAGGIRIAGVDDPRIAGRIGIVDVLRQSDRDKFVLLAIHRPETPPEARGLFDLQLSGHTHGGQIWPGHYYARLVHGYFPGSTALPPVAGGNGKGGLLYLTGGVGCWGPPIRFLIPPEILVVDLTR